MNYAEVLRSIVPRLEQSEVPYMITGSIAAAYYGLNRATYDLDIVISATVTFEEVPTFVIRAEDLILSKLEWAKMGESERQIKDAAVVLEKRGRKLDLPYMKSGSMKSA